MRYLSFIETGRARPSGEMVLHLAERLDVSLRERNHLLLAAGFASPANALRIALHPDGMTPRISNLAEWSGYLLARLRRTIEATRDPELESLYQELVAYPGVTPDDRAIPANPDDILLMHELRLDSRRLMLFSTLTTFGTARDLTLDELTIEAFYPADPRTREALTAAVSETHRD